MEQQNSFEYSSEIVQIFENIFNAFIQERADILFINGHKTKTKVEQVECVKQLVLSLSHFLVKEKSNLSITKDVLWFKNNVIANNKLYTEFINEILLLNIAKEFPACCQGETLLLNKDIDINKNFLSGILNTKDYNILSEGNFVVSKVVGRYIRLKKIGEKDRFYVTERFYHQSRFNKLINNNTQLSLPMINYKKVEDKVESLGEHLFVKAKRNTFLPFEGQTIYNKFTGTVYYIDKIDPNSKEIQCYSEKNVNNCILELENFREHVYQTYGTDNHGKAVQVRSWVKIDPFKIDQFMALNGWPKENKQNSQYDQYVTLLINSEFFIQDFIYSDTNGKAAIINIDKDWISKQAKLDDFDLLLPCSWMEKYDPISKTNTETSGVDVVKRRERLRLEREEEAKNEEIDKQGGPYVLDNYLNKIVKIDNFRTQWMNGEFGLVQSIDNNLGRIFIKFVKDKHSSSEYYFRASAKELDFIQIISDQIISDEEIVVETKEIQAATPA